MLLAFAYVINVSRLDAYSIAESLRDVLECDQELS